MTATITTLPLGPLQTNGYLISSAGRAVMIDPGGDAHLVISEVKRQDVTLEAIWLTHSHFDHVGGITDILQEFNVPVRMHPDGAELLSLAEASARGYGLPFTAPPTTFTPLSAGEVLTVGDVTAHVLPTPGHAPGHCAFYLPNEGVVLSGDALFQGSIGRTDLAFADHDTLIRSIVEQLLVLPNETIVLSGHGPATTIGDERVHNPFLPRS